MHLACLILLWDATVLVVLASLFAVLCMVAEVLDI